MLERQDTAWQHGDSTPNSGNRYDLRHFYITFATAPSMEDETNAITLMNVYQSSKLIKIIDVFMHQTRRNCAGGKGLHLICKTNNHLKIARSTDKVSNFVYVYVFC